MRSAENKEFWKLRSMENVEYGKCECGNIERFPFEQKLRKFRFGVKRKTFFGLPDWKKWSCSKGNPVFSGWNVPTGLSCSNCNRILLQNVSILFLLIAAILSFSIALRIPTAHDSRVISTPTRALERTHNVSNYSQTKPDSEINARFIWNEYGDLYFALHKFGVKRILFKLKIETTCVEGKNNYIVPSAQNFLPIKGVLITLLPATAKCILNL